MRINYNKIRKAVIPAAGLGTRWLPATKVIPKELLPICGKPIVQFAVEEAAASGIETVILAISRDKQMVAEYFHRNEAMEEALLRRGKSEEATLIRELCDLAEIQTVYQDTPLGLADAIRCSRILVGNEPFAVILPDALIDSEVPCTKQLMDCFQIHQGCVVATREVEPSETHRFGIVETAPIEDPLSFDRTLRVVSLVERPKPGTVPSVYGIFGRYILEPEIFASIEQLSPGFGGELQLTDSLLSHSKRHPVFAYCFEGSHYDAGSKRGFFEATLAYSFKDPELAGVTNELAKDALI